MSNVPRRIAVLALFTAACSGAPAALRPFAVVPVPSPGGPGAAWPRLTGGGETPALLSWTEPDGDAHVLRFAAWEDGAWGAARTAARGTNWFVNWADVPGVSAGAAGVLAAHWLEQEGEGTYAYGVRTAVSSDGGATWTEPLAPHRDGTETEHGFVSCVPDADGFRLVWLDGREMAGGGGEGHDGHGHGHGAGAMTVRSARLGPDGVTGAEELLDSRACDCCPTAALRTDDGTLLVAYRDRSADEVRDIAVSRRRDGAWTTPVRVHADGWNVAGCPVNGPALAAGGGRIACAWYTEGPTGRAEVRVAFSRDGGRTFGPARRVDDGAPAGRAGVAMERDGTAAVIWLESTGEAAEVRVRRVPADGEPGPSVTVARVPDSRASGFPRIERAGERFLAAWTVPGEPFRVETAVLE